MSNDLVALIGRREFIAGGTALALLGSQGASAGGGSTEELLLGRDQRIDLGWRFFRGAGTAFESPSLDDSGWRLVDLPHDWSVEDATGGPDPDRLGPFDKSAEGGTATGFTVGGEGWYRKRFHLPNKPEESHVEIQFEGVCLVCDVWINGHLLGSHVHGYTPFAYDLTPHIVRGGDNVIAVRVRNVGRNSRWYSGSGIYRPVTIDVLVGPSRLARWGIGAWTRHIDEHGAEIDVTTRLESTEPAMTVRTRLLDASGAIVAEEVAPAAREVQQSLKITKPHLWSPTSPQLYTLESTLLDGNAHLDAIRQPFGVRIVTFDADHGLRVNEERVHLRGGCVHHDNGLLGAVSFADAEERRILLLKARGFTAIRSSHNPCSSAFRLACDRHGILLIEEAFDAWQVHKTPDDYSTYFREHWESDLGSMVLSARNSPSVIMWSIGNEIPERTSNEGLEYSWRLANAVHRLDPTRPVTAAIHAFPGRPVVAGEFTARRGAGGVPAPAATVFLDVVGYNYKLDEIERDHALYPQRVFYGSETFPHDAYGYQDLSQRAPYMLGEFVWTAMDYLGEAGIGLSTFVPLHSQSFSAIDFPVVVSSCGDIDLIGNQRPQSLMRDVVWGKSALEITVQRPAPEGMEERIPPWGWRDELQSWTWPALEGRALTLRIYTAGDRVEARLNGDIVETRSITSSDKMQVAMSIPYRPGSLEVIAYRNNAEIGRRLLVTTSPPAKIRVRPESVKGSAARHALSFVQLEVLDAHDRLVPDAQQSIQLVIDGPGELIAFGSANPRAVGSLQSTVAQSYLGRALAVVRSRGKGGTITVKAVATGLQMGHTVIRLS
jgi:beta-galactosidase